MILFILSVRDEKVDKKYSTSISLVEGDKSTLRQENEGREYIGRIGTLGQRNVIDAAPLGIY